MASPAFEGEVRSRTWRLVIWEGYKAELDPTWEQRARDYWTRQERLYGLEMSNFTLAADNFADIGPVITTFAVVKRVLPGERVDGMQLAQ